MAKEPAERYRSAGELGAAAQAAALEAEAPRRERVEAAPPAPPAKDARPRRWLAVGAAGLLVLVVAVAAIVALSGGDDEATQPDRATAAPSAPLRAASTWRRLPSIPTARQNMAATVLDGTIWVVGGMGERSKATPRVEGYDPVIKGWKSGPDLPVPLHHEMVVTYKEEPVVIGGWIPKGADQSAIVSDRVFALRDGRWEELPSLQRPRAAGAAAVVGDKIVVVGGQDDNRLIDTTEVFDGKRWTSGADIPTPREHLAAASDGSYLYAVGGRALSPDKNSAALERYDPAADRWERLPDMPTARGGLGAAIAGAHLFAVGGESPTGAMGEVESYAIARKAWSSAPSMRTARHGIAAAAVGRTLYALGGAPRAGHASAVATAEVTPLTR